jgi:hypothetical protein
VPGTATAPALCGVLSAPTKASLTPGSGGHSLVYTASLVQTVAQAEPASGLFVCHVAEATPAVATSRRRSGPNATA